MTRFWLLLLLIVASGFNLSAQLGLPSTTVRGGEGQTQRVGKPSTAARGNAGRALYSGERHNLAVDSVGARRIFD